MLSFWMAARLMDQRLAQGRRRRSIGAHFGSSRDLCIESQLKQGREEMHSRRWQTLLMQQVITQGCASADPACISNVELVIVRLDASLLLL